jgi:hypothetical protein
MSKLAYLLIIIVIIAYIQSYCKAKTDLKINQCFLDTFKQDLLYEKYPIVIYDSVRFPEDLLETALKYAYMFKKYVQVRPGPFFDKNKSKYSLMYFSEDATLDLSPQINSAYVTIKLKEHQVVIVPYLWYYRSEQPINCIHLDDILSKMLGLW